MKRLISLAAAVFFSVALFAQPGGFGGFGGGMPPMGGDMMGMGDPFAFIKEAIADAKTAELTEVLGLTAKQAKQVKNVYMHADIDMSSMMPEGFPMGGPGMGGFPGGMGQMPPMGQMPEWMGGQGGEMPKFDPEHPMKPREFPISDKERAWREKKMQKILTPEQYEKWASIEAKKDEEQ